MSIDRVNLTDFETVDNLALEDDAWANVMAIDQDNGFLYSASNFDNPGIIRKISLETYTEVDSLTLDSPEGGISLMLIDTTNGLLYVGCSPYGFFIKINLATFTKVTTLVLPDGFEDVTLVCGFLDVDNDFAYLGDSYLNQIIRVTLSTMAKESVLVLTQPASGFVAISSCAVDLATGYSYWCLPPTSHPTSALLNVIKVRHSDFSENATLSISTKVTHSGNYRCIKGHLSSADTEPGVGANWATYWASYSAGGAAWALDTYYAATPSTPNTTVCLFDSEDNLLYLILPTTGVLRIDPDSFEANSILPLTVTTVRAAALDHTADMVGVYLYAGRIADPT